MSKIIIHVDINAFFAEVEQIKDPSLRGKPIAVGGETGRGVLSTASYEARKFGVGSAMPIGEARAKCPNLIIKSVDMESYRKYSNLFFKLIKKHFSNDIEIMSIDECYVDYTPKFSKNENLEAKIKEFQENIKNKVGLRCSFGVAPNKFLAKMASNMKKPMGITILRKKDVSNLLWPLSIAKMHGIGAKTAPKLEEVGIKTIGDLAKEKNQEYVRNILGSNYYTYVLKANGEYQSDVVIKPREAKSIGNSSTFRTDLSDLEEIKIELLKLAKSVSRRITTISSLAFGITITIRYSDFKTITRSKALQKPISETEELYLKALNLLEKNHNFEKKIRLLGISLFDIKEKNEVIKQLNLFEVDLSKKEVDEIISSLNKKIGSSHFKRASEVNKKDD